MASVGMLTKAALVEIEPGCFLSVRASRSYRKLKVAFKARGKTLTPVGEFACYRSAHLQNAMADASRTAKGSAARRRYNLSSTSTVSVAYHPNGSHEDGRTFDFLLNGSSAYPSLADRQVFAKYGWSFQFGSADPNHVRHNNLTGITPNTRAWCIKNGLYVGKK